MFITQDALGQTVTAQIEPGDGPVYIAVEITRLTGQANAAWLTPRQAFELAAALVTRAIEAEVTESIVRVSAPSARLGLVES